MNIGEMIFKAFGSKAYVVLSKAKNTVLRIFSDSAFPKIKYKQFTIRNTV